MLPKERLAASFRDPNGFLFQHNGCLYRQVNHSYAPHFDKLMASGLYAQLIDAGLLIPHVETDGPSPEPKLASKIIQPEPVAFISYPYEWSFSQLKDAALTTLRIQQAAMAAGMVLKDASAYNIQFHRGRPLLIDTLSFEIYQEGQPWVAYRQFCQHFLAPLALMAHKDVRLSQLLRVYIDGVPLDLASRLLPWRTKLSFSLLSHIHLHASAQKRYADQPEQGNTQRQLSQRSLAGVIDSLHTAVSKLTWEASGTEWADYYAATNYTDSAADHKAHLVEEYLAQTPAKTVWDLGANTGRYSRIAAAQGLNTVAFDIDPAAVERGYLAVKDAEVANLLPLLLDLTNPSPGLGWHHRERSSLQARANADVVMALALVHHLAIGNNVPLPHIADFLADLAPWLIIEFVSKEDSQVQRLLATREDIFPHYTRAGFESAFSQRYVIHRQKAITDAGRVLYLMERQQ